MVPVAETGIWKMAVSNQKLGLWIQDLSKTSFAFPMLFADS
jgi:hypothetical protein